MATLLAIGGVVGAVALAATEVTTDRTTTHPYLGAGIVMGVTALAFASLLLLVAWWAYAWTRERGPSSRAWASRRLRSLATRCVGRLSGDRRGG